MEKHDVPHHFPSSKLNEAFKVDISLSNITRKRVCERNKLHPPSYSPFLKTTLQQIVPSSPSHFPSLPARKLPGNNSKPCPSVPPAPSLNHLQIDYLKPTHQQLPVFCGQNDWFFKGLLENPISRRASNSRELRHDDGSDINKSQRHGGSPLSGRARKLEEPQGKTSFNTEEKSFRTYRV